MKSWQCLFLPHVPCNVDQAVSQGWLFLPCYIARECVKEGVLDSVKASLEYGMIYSIYISKRKDGGWGSIGKGISPFILNGYNGFIEVRVQFSAKH